MAQYLLAKISRWTSSAPRPAGEKYEVRSVAEIENETIFEQFSPGRRRYTVGVARYLRERPFL